jgi:cbb3-type cytochrome oxidase subunit 3
MPWFDIAMLLRPVLLVLMLIIVLGIAVWSYWPSRRAQFEDRAMIPLRDDYEI